MNTTTQNTEREAQFASKIAKALDQNADQLPSQITRRLANARKDALLRMPRAQVHVVPVLAPVSVGGADAPSGWFSRFGNWFSGLSVAVPAMALMLAVGGMYWWHSEQIAQETAEIDAAVLADNVPVQVYSDKAFGQYLTNRGEE